MHDKHFSLSKPDSFDCMGDPCWNLFDNAIRRDATKKNYHKAMERFLKFSRLDRYCDFKELEYDRLKTILSSFVIDWKRQGLVYPSCNNYLSAIELFLEMNEISYPKRVIRKLLPSNDKKQGGRNPYTTDEIKRIYETFSFVIDWKRQGLVYPSCNNYLSAIELFLEMNEIRYLTV